MQARVSLSRNKIDDAMREFHQMEEIIARLIAAHPGNPRMQVNLLRIQREFGHVAMSRLGDSETAQRFFRMRP